MIRQANFLFISVVDLFVFLGSEKMAAPCLLCTGWNYKQDDGCKFQTTAMLKFANSQHYPPAPFAKFIGSLMRL